MEEEDDDIKCTSKELPTGEVIYDPYGCKFVKHNIALVH